MKTSHLSQQMQTESLQSPPTNLLPGLWTARIAAQRAGFQSPVTILRAFRRGDLRGFKLNARAVRFDPKDVEAWLAAARVGPNNESP